MSLTHKEIAEILHKHWGPQKGSRTIHRRIISLEGDKEWVEKTLSNSLPDGINQGPFGEGRLIRVETIVGTPIETPGSLSRKPEKRFEKVNLLKRSDNDRINPPK